MSEKNQKSLADRFIVPPFSVFDQRQGYWKSRKKEWIELGIQSEIGRGEYLTYSKSAQSPSIYSLKNKMGNVSWDEVLQAARDKGMKTMHGTSIFDPVLCEIAYAWFGQKGFDVLDPFCGGSVRGIVAAACGLSYVGIDLREEQIIENTKQISEILPNSPVKYITGDSRNVKELTKNSSFDLIFTCPPYHDLEVYLNISSDLSNMDYLEFQHSYAKIIRESVDLLKENRFAVFVISDVRDKSGFYKMLSYDTIKAFEDCGMKLWNEIILLNEYGSLPIRAARPMITSRKVGRTHQKILVFFKGNPSTLKEFGEIGNNQLLLAA